MDSIYCATICFIKGRTTLATCLSNTKSDDASRKKTDNTLFSESGFSIGIDKYEHSAYCVEIAYKSNVKPTDYQHIDYIIIKMYFNLYFVFAEHSRKYSHSFLT